MSAHTRTIYRAGGEESIPFFGVTIGTVVSVNDPMQLGRVRALCPYFGDRPAMLAGDIPWAMYCSPAFGNTFRGQRGGALTKGGVTYGFWAIPKVGTQVLIGCIDGDTNHRVWMGCVTSAASLYTANTIPHGRYSYTQGGEPGGPLSTEDQPIEPLHTNQTQAFGQRSGNFEWRTRGADYNVSALDKRNIKKSRSKMPDDKFVPFSRPDGSTPFVNTQGYHTSQIAPNLGFKDTGGKNFDSSVFALTSPGFHGISMDDRPENQRIRLRTTNGTQIILDDTNERIYINVSNGAAWIQIDEDGTIEFYGKSKINIHSENDINLTSDKTVRIFGKTGVHIRADQGELRLFSKANMNLSAEKEVRITSSAKMNLKSGADMLLTGGPNIHLNGPAATPADPAFFTNRVPTHEPWQRISTKEDTSHAPKLPYESPQNAKEDKSRGPHWHR